MARPFTQKCVYTILHPDRLAEAAALRGPSTFVVRQRMVAAETILQGARATKERVAVLFGDATDCSRLVYWGTLVSISVGTNDTHYSVCPLLPLEPGYRPQDLTLDSSGERIAEGFIRPYAICRRPTFLPESNETAWRAVRFDLLLGWT